MITLPYVNKGKSAVGNVSATIEGDDDPSFYDDGPYDEAAEKPSGLPWLSWVALGVAAVALVAAAVKVHRHRTKRAQAPVRASDIAAMCVQNLKRRRARAILTALVDGVVAASGKFDTNTYSFSLRLKAGLMDRYQTYWANVVGLDADSLDAVGYSPVKGEQISSDVGASSGFGNQDAPVEALAGQRLACNFVDSYRPEGANQVDRYPFMYSDQGEYLGNDVEMPAPFVNLLDCGPVTLEIADWDDNVLASQQIVFTGVLKESCSAAWWGVS